MATVKVFTLLIRTAAKPISTQIKIQAKQHERFRGFCVSLAQMLHRSEVKLRTNILGEPAKVVRPLSETRAIETGANFIAEGFLFSVALALIAGENWRSARNQSKRRDTVDDQLEDLGTTVQELSTRVNTMADAMETRLDEERQRNDELSRILERIVEIGLRGGWTEFEGNPLPIPRVDLRRRPALKSKHDTEDLTIDTSGKGSSEDEPDRNQSDSSDSADPSSSSSSP
ncbi:OPA3-domain-containing protein [Pterulicium gracile]|uniref:OPA3-domain-containing protein n=1 Tax=Pterulicium gracile TaxID=1884261 RepID=A0A5C3R4T9_9AGAR|nr:OPA3-domain-containing protein [Pterula gracilis]